jgi:hypothetical protein
MELNIDDYVLNKWWGCYLVPYHRYRFSERENSTIGLDLRKPKLVVEFDLKKMK